MSIALTTHPFGDIIDFQEGPGIMAVDFRDDGVPLVRLSGLSSSGSVLDGCNYLDPQMVEEKWRHFRLRQGDTLLSTSAALGRVAVVEPGAEGAVAYTGIIRMRPCNDLLDGSFIRYLLLGSEFQQQAEAVGVGSVMRHFGPSHLRTMSLTIPSPTDQRKIAAILSAYDDLIENHNRRIKILEEIAQRIYREWFVEFRYPGHQTVPLVESELGPIPHGWQVETLLAVCDVMQAGGTPSRANADFWNDGTIDWFKTTELRDGFLQRSAERVSSAALMARKTRLFPADTILMAIYGAPTVGRMGVLTADGCCNQAALALRTDEARLPQSALYYALLELRGHFNSIAQGAAQQNISKEKVAETKVVCPSAELARMWTRTVEPSWRQRRTLARTLSTLRATRDLLLPRLISGDIDVTDLDIAMPHLFA